MAERRAWQARLSGSGGQGLGLAGRLLADALVAEGWRVALSQSYEPTSRGGLSRSDLVVDGAAVDYPLATDLGYLVLLDPSGLEESVGLLVPGALVIVDGTRVAEPPAGARVLALLETARALGNPRIANVVALGALVAAADLCPRPVLEHTVLSSAPRRFADLNLAALRAGFTLAA